MSNYIGYINDYGSVVIAQFNNIIKKKSRAFFTVKCHCGNEFKVLKQHFLSGATVSCGCTRSAQNLNLTGQVINRLTVINMLPPLPSDSKRRQRALVKCHCGKEFIAIASELKRNRIHSCGCIIHSSMTIRRAKNKGKNPIDQTWDWFFKTYINGAKNRNLCFDLTLDDVKNISQQPCYYCGLAPSPRFRYTKNNKLTDLELNELIIYVNGIDRLDSELGYTKDNCVSCCTECNYHKGVYTENQFNKWIERVYMHQHLKCI